MADPISGCFNLNEIMNHESVYMGFNADKTVFSVSDIVRIKTDCSSTESS